MKPLRLYGKHSGKTVSGLNRIARILKPEVHVVKEGPLDPSKYDGVITHNVFEDPFEGKLPWVLYLASRRTASLVTKERLRLQLAVNPPKAIWVNQETGRQMLEKVGVKAKTMYRPNRLAIPIQCPEPPKERKIL
jgi:hypothetical protein